MKTRNCFGFYGFLIVSFLCLLPLMVEAAMAEYRQLIRQHPNIMHNYSFEGPHGPMPGDILRDWVGTNNLKLWSSSAGGSIAYIEGIDGFSIAGRTIVKPEGQGYGAAWNTTAAVEFSDTLSVECVFNPRFRSTRGGV